MIVLDTDILIEIFDKGSAQGEECTITSKIFGFNPQQLLEHLNREKQNS